MYKIKHSSEDNMRLLYWLSIALVFLFIPENFPEQVINMEEKIFFITRGLMFFIFYMFPTLYFVIFLSQIDFKALPYNLKSFKKCISEIILMLLGIIIAIYIFIINVYNICFSIPILLTSIELLLIRYMEVCAGDNFINSKWQNHIILKDKISEKELKRYNKWNEIGYSLIYSLFCSIGIMMLMLMPLNAFNILNILGLKYTCIILFICAFIPQIFFRKILECKLNLFVKMEGICTDFRPVRFGGSHEITNFENKKVVFIIVNRKTYNIGEKVTVIYGALSGTAIGFY